VHVRLRQEVAVGEIHVLDALGRNVLALGELEHVLAAVDDREAAQRVDGADVARVEPAVGVDGFAGFRFVAEVLAEARGAAHEDLAAGEGAVGYEVVHVRDRFETYFHWKRGLVGMYGEG
jgi:hypothetical protein